MNKNKYLVFDVEIQTHEICNGKLLRRIDNPKLLDPKNITIHKSTRYAEDERPTRKKESRFKPKLGRDLPPFTV